MIFDLYTTLKLESVPQRTVLTRAMSRIYAMDNPIGNPFGGPAYGEYNSAVVEIISDAGRWIDREVLQPVYREVIQPVGQALETIGKGIAKDPLTFIAQAAAVALAPATGGQSLWALPVISAASTAAKGGSMEQILTATAISAATAAIGGGFGIENSVGGLITSGLQTGVNAAGQATFGIMGTSITATTAQAIATAGTGIAMAGVQGVGAAMQGKDPLMAALPSLVGSALGFAGNMAAQAEFFAPISNALNELSKNTSPIVSKAMTGVASAMITGAVTGKDMSQVALAGLANTVVSGLVSASGVVQEFFAKDDGSITNLGVAAQSVVADLVGSVAATLASGGKLGTEMGAQFLASTIKTIMPLVTDPKFDAMATNVRATYEAAEKKVTALNGAANSQQALVDKYNADAAETNRLAGLVNDDIKKRDEIVKLYNAATTQGDIDKYRKQFNEVEARIAENTKAFNSIYDTIDDTNAAYLESVKATEAAQKEYFEISKTLGTYGTELSTKMNEISKEMITNVAKDIDPTFDAEAYKKLNNLGPSIDPAVHFLSVGKDQGLPTNYAAAGPELLNKKSALVDAILESQGWNPKYMSVPPSIRKTAMDMVNSQFGSNLAVLKDMTPEMITSMSKSGFGKPLDSFAPKYNSDAAKSAMFDQVVKESLAPGWYKPDSSIFSMPTGMLYASQEQVAAAMAGKGDIYTSVDNNGNTVYLYQDPNYKPIKKYNSETGNVEPTASVLTDMVTMQSMNAVDRAKFLAKMDAQTTKYLNDQLKSNAASDGQAFAQKFINFVNDQDIPSGLRDVAMSALSGLGSAAKWTGDIIDDWGYLGQQMGSISILMDVASIAEKRQTIAGEMVDAGKYMQNWANGLKDAAAAERSSDVKSQIEANMSLLANAKDATSSIDAFKTMISENGAGFAVGFVAEEYFEEVYQTIASLAGGVKNIPILSAAFNAVESYSGGRTEVYNRTKAILLEKGLSEQEAEWQARVAGIATGVADAGITFAADAAVGTSLANTLGKIIPGSQSAITKIITAPITAAITEAITGIPEEALQGGLSELAIAHFDPSKANFGSAMTQGALFGFTVGGSTAFGAASTAGAGSVAYDMMKSAINANTSFAQELFDSRGSIEKLGNVLKTWIPAGDSEAGNGFYAAMVPTVLEMYPVDTSSYQTAQQYFDDVSKYFVPSNVSGVLQRPVIESVANVVNQKFDQQVTTAEEARQALENAGLAGATLNDAINAGVVGVTTQDQSNKISQYTNQQMVSEEEARAAAAQENYEITQEDLGKLVGRGVEAEVIAKFISEVDPKAVTTAEASQYFKELGYTNAQADEIAQFVKSTPEEQIKQSLGEYVDIRQVTREEAVGFYQELGYTPTEQEIQQFIKHGKDIKEAQVKSDLGGYVDPRMVDSQEVKDMLQSMGLIVPPTEADIARLSGQYMETELAGKAKEALPVVAANATYAETKRVADLVGKPAQDVTQADFDYIRSVVEGTAQGQANLAYDANQDGKIDQADLDLVKSRLDIQQNQNIQQQIDPETGLTVYVDTTTGQPITAQPPALGGQWAPTGIYAALQQQEARQAQIAKAQSQQAKQAQQKNQFGQLMNMIFSAPDAAGQEVTVKTPEPSKINYIYDWSSIFATPAQASMMPSPYGPMNTVAPQQQKQPANQPMFQMASGFAEGGIVGGNDINVGDGGSVDDLINLLKGNSG